VLWSSEAQKELVKGRLPVMSASDIAQIGLERLIDKSLVRLVAP
jgi:hypothetical protein